MNATSPGAPAAQPPQRVCPRCSTIARTVEPSCPFCRRSYTRRGPWAAALTAALVCSVLVLAGVAVMLDTFGGVLEDELDAQVTAVERDFDRDVRRLERRILEQIDARLPAVAPGG